MISYFLHTKPRERLSIQVIQHNRNQGATAAGQTPESVIRKEVFSRAKNPLLTVPVYRADQVGKPVHLQGKYLVAGHAHAGLGIGSQHLRATDHFPVNAVP